MILEAAKLKLFRYIIREAVNTKVKIFPKPDDCLLPGDLGF
jgi:hypothetical protein